MRIFLILLLLTSCKSTSSPLSKWLKGEFKVLSTTEMVGDLVQQIGGNQIAHLTLITGELDPHTYQLVKGDDEKFSQADLIFYNGLGLEHGPSIRSQLENNPKAVSVGNAIAEKLPERILYYNGIADPHVWTDVSLWREGVDRIVQAFSEKDPKYASEYATRGEKLKKKLDALDGEIRAQLQSIPDGQRYLVTSHDAFNYFSRAYLATEEERHLQTWDPRFEAPEGLAPDSQLSVADIQHIVDHLEKYRIHVLFPESNVSQDSIKKIVDAGQKRGMNLRISGANLYGDAMGTDNYIDMMRHNARTIYEQLRN